jgi:hypothetical protein
MPAMKQVEIAGNLGVFTMRTLRYFLTFAGAGSAVYLFGRAISAIDVSAPPEEGGSEFKKIGFVAGIALFFVLCEAILGQRSLHRFRSVLLNAAIVSGSGSFGILMLLFLGGLIAGYVGVDHIVVEGITGIVFGILLSILTFPSILFLHSTAYLVLAVTGFSGNTNLN